VKKQTTYTIRLVPLPTNKDAVRSLRALLKTALRRFHLRCIEAREDAKEE
jgi:hypothetical protein